jgi:surface polysaccharide O-acyltransferase-like enzyme
MNTAAPTVISSRRADVDSLRVLALALLIAYHVLLIYTGREFWRVNSSYHGYWADYLIAALTPWRMALVFLIGGVAVRFMFSRPSFGAFVGERAARLLTAFVFAVVVLVPPQRYVRLDVLGENPNIDYLTYLVHEAPFAVPYLGVQVPQFAHAWFLPYLFAYSCLAAALWWFAPKLFRALQAAAERAPTPVWIVATMVWFAFVESYFSTRSAGDRLFFTDWAAHAKFVPVFMLGVLLGKSAQFQQQIGRVRIPVWLVAAGALLLSVGLEWLMLHGRPDLGLAWEISRGLYGGAMLWSVVAFGHWALNRPSRALTYASDAILPVYLMHQTVLVLVADVVVNQRWPMPIEVATLFSAASILPLAIYHFAVRRTPWLRFLFGLRPKLRDRTPGAPPTSKPQGEIDYAHAPPVR